jgi:hypothetical protein
VRRLKPAVESGERMQIGPHGELGDRGEGGVSDRIQWELLGIYQIGIPAT